MKKIKKLIFRIIEHQDFLPFILFTLIFTVYFSSSVGLMNSGDATQYFTAEALINFKDVDMAHFESDPHYFVWPDIYYRNVETLSVRGYLISFIMIPFHLISKLTGYLLKVNNFSNEIKSSNFNYELSVVSFYTFFSALSILFVFLIIKEITNKVSLSFLVSLFFAFGTYIWKYSSYYTRHGVACFLLGFSLLSFYRYLNNNKKNYLLFYLLSTVISFGVDIVLFVSLLSFIFFIPKKIIFFKKNFLIILSSIIIFFTTIIFNHKFYGTLWSQQVNLWHPLTNIFGKQTAAIFLSAPISSVLPTVLFNFNKIPSNVFLYFDKYPKEILTIGSVNYAKKYNFYGIFFISPFLLLSFLIFLVPDFFKKNRKKINLLFFSILIFFVTVILNSKIFYFWGGNQYDVRYFYPYTIALAIPLSFTLKFFLKLKNKIIKYLFRFIFFSFGFWSIFMGWLGVINMYKPALTGERKIWLDLYDVPYQLFKHTSQEYLNATFMNRENAWIAVILSLLGYLIYRLFLFLMIKIKLKLKQLNKKF